MLTAATFAMSAVASATAPASVPPVVQEQLDSVTDLVQRGGATNAVPSPADQELLDRLYQAERDAKPNSSVGSRLARELRRLRVGARVLPSLKFIGQRVLPAIGAFALGLKIGSELRPKLLGIELPARGPQTLPGDPIEILAMWLYGVERGDCMAYNQLSLECTQGMSQRAPADGFRVVMSLRHQGIQYVSDSFADTCFNNSYPHVSRAPAGSTMIAAPGSVGCAPVYESTSTIARVFLDPDVVSVDAYTGQPFDVDTPAPPDVPHATAKSRVEDELNSRPDEYPTVTPWLCAHLGGDCQDPTGQLITLPTCLGMTFQACESALRQNGLQGAITERALSQDDAIMEEAAGRTTAIYPGGGMRFDTDVTVYVNPDTMPTMTAIEATVADQILQKNPGVEPDPESGRPRIAAETIARRCVKAVGKEPASRG